MRGSLIVLTFFAAGLMAGLTQIVSSNIFSDQWSNLVLYVLMFLAGIGIGSDTQSWKVIRSINYRIFLVPPGIIVGTFLGTALVSLLLPDLTLRESLAVGSGFGYYSLSSLFISKLHSETLGVIALLSNIMREISTLLLTPLWVHYFGKLAGIASGGATSMDTTLPIISKFSGKDYAIISLFSGVVLTILVPFLVTLILTVAK